jgi:transposase
MIPFEKYGHHQAGSTVNLNVTPCARERVELSVSTLADQVGGCTMLVRWLYDYDLICAHLFAEPS